MAKLTNDIPVIQAFDSVEPASAKVLILGSMPGVASLEASAYYAHPRNAFWPIMEYLLNQRCSCYEDRIALIKQHQIALWDVLRECRRPGSLDANIVRDSVRVNDFENLLKRHPILSTIAFNGKAAEKMFRTHVLKTARGEFRNRLEMIKLVSLPSSSPAMASLSLSAKQVQWHTRLSASLVSLTRIND